MTAIRTILLLLLCELSALGATSWYVDPQATGANNGTNWANAWTNLNNVVWGTLGVAAGHTLYLSGGETSRTYTNGCTVGASGTAANRITIRVGQDAGHNGVVIFDGQQFGNHCPDSGVLILHGRNFLTIDGEVNGQKNMRFLNWRNWTNKNLCNVIYGAPSSDNTFKHLVISNANTPIFQSWCTNNIVAWCDLSAYGDTCLAFNNSERNALGDWDSTLIFSNTFRCAFVWTPWVVTATLTVTNIATNGNSITINGITRDWTNEFSDAHILTNLASLVACASNLYYCYKQYPISYAGINSNAGVRVWWVGVANSNVIVTPSPGWASVSYSTNWDRNAPDGIQCDDAVTIFNNRFEMIYTASETNVANHNDYLQSGRGRWMKFFNNDVFNTQDSQCSPAHFSSASGICDIRIYNNVFHFGTNQLLFDTIPQCIRMYNSSGLLGYTNILIANNLFIDRTNGTQAIYLAEDEESGNGTNNWVANNIFVNVGMPTAVLVDIPKSTNAGQSHWTVTNNLYYHSLPSWMLIKYYGTNYTIPDWISSYDPSGVTNIPAFIDYIAYEDDSNFRLLGSDTNALDRGMDLSAYFSTDFDGNIRSGTWDIGPFEYTADAPSISVHPASTNIYGGQSVTFSVTASGSAPLVYTWKLDGVAIPGATNNTFTTNLARMAANGGVYKVAVTNAEGGVESDEATLGVSAFHETLYCPVEPWAVRSYPMISSNAILLVWPTNQYRTEIRVARRNYTNKPSAWNTWVWLWTNVDPDTVTMASDYLDSTVATGVHYEYTVAMLATNWVCTSTNDPRWGYQYINTGIELPLKDERGHLILLVESGIASSIATELATFTNDLIGDGYKLHLHTVAASDITNAAITNTAWFAAVTNTKALVVADYATDPTADWSLFILGHVPLPYSGSNSPGSHVDNVGAHPTDWYYAITNEAVWTDTIINYVNTSNLHDNELHTSNLPGDGKFDTNYIPAIPQMRVGRVDLRNMPAFGKTEVQLLSQYLTRDHAWRHSQVTVRDRGAVSTNNRPEESHGIFSSTFGPGDNLDVGRFLTIATNSSSNFLFLHSAGGGLYTWDEQSHNSTNHGYTTNYAQAGSLYGVFLRMHGSYYGDIDTAMHSNLIFAAPLCMDGLPLVVEYVERNMGYEPWAINEPIGQSMLTLVANWLQVYTKAYVQYADIYGGTNYQFRIFPSMSYEHLLGDPTLRIRNVNPPTNVVASTNGSDIVLTWTASTDTNVQGYHVYRAPAADLNDRTRLTTPPTNTPYTDVGGASAAYTYMVRAVKLEEYPTRSFYNASQGIFATTEAGGGEPSTNVVKKIELRGSRITPRGKLTLR